MLKSTKKVVSKIKEKVLKIVKSSKMPLYAISFIILLAHIFMPTDMSDDAWFYTILEGQDSPVRAVLDFVKYRYNNWSSRVLIEALLVVIVRVPVLWKILDSVVLIYIIFKISSLLNSENSRRKNVIISTVLILFPFWILYEAGFIATSLNYLWPLGGMLSVIGILYKRFTNRKIAKYEYILALFGLIYSSFSELACGALSILFICSGIYYFYNRKKVPVLELVCLAFCALMIIYTLSCPGNDIRYEAEVITWLPEHASLNFVSKAELGFRVMLYQILLKPSALVPVFLISLIFGAAIINKKRANIIISAIPLFYMLVVICFSGALKDYFVTTEIGIVTVILDIFAINFLIGILYSLRLIIRDIKEYCLVFLSLAIGAITKIALGLSPTLVISSPRATIFLYFSISIALGVVIEKTVNKAKKIDKIK